MSNTIAGLTIKNTSNNLSPDKRFCTFIFARPKVGKTRMVGTLDALTKKHFGKPTLIVACEPSDGGGTDSLIEMGVDYLQPSSMKELLTIMKQLHSDTKYGGVAIDSLTEVAKRFLIPYSVQNLPTKPAFNTLARQQFGTPGPDDYLNAGELLRQIINEFVSLSSTPNIETRKHVVGTSIVKYITDWSKGGEVVDIKPDVPGGMAETVNAIFQTIGTLNVVRDKGGLVWKFVTSKSEGGFGKYSSLGDRYGIPPVVNADFVEIYEQHWLPRIKPNG